MSNRFIRAKITTSKTPYLFSKSIDFSKYSLKTLSLLRTKKIRNNFEKNNQISTRKSVNNLRTFLKNSINNIRYLEVPLKNSKRILKNPNSVELNLRCSNTSRKIQRINIPELNLKNDNMLKTFDLKGNNCSPYSSKNNQVFSKAISQTFYLKKVIQTNKNKELSENIEKSFKNIGIKFSMNAKKIGNSIEDYKLSPTKKVINFDMRKSQPSPIDSKKAILKSPRKASPNFITKSIKEINSFKDSILKSKIDHLWENAMNKRNDKLSLFTIDSPCVSPSSRYNQKGITRNKKLSGSMNQLFNGTIPFKIKIERSLPIKNNILVKMKNAIFSSLYDLQKYKLSINEVFFIKGFKK